MVSVTRSTLVKVSTSCINIVADQLVRLLEDLARPYKNGAQRPPHIRSSEVYIVVLLSACFASHWRRDSNGSAYDGAASSSNLPDPLNDGLVGRILDVLRGIANPISEGFVLPAKTIIADSAAEAFVHHGELDANDDGSPTEQKPRGAEINGRSGDGIKASNGHSGGSGAASGSGRAEGSESALDSSIKTIVEYVTASSWPRAFDYFRSVIYNVRTTLQVQPAGGQSQAQNEDERSALSLLRLLSAFWVDGHKLSQILQEICAAFLHFRKPYQNAVAIVTPLLITRWIDRRPDEFVRLHKTQEKSYLGIADTLFDMAQTVVENGRRKAILYPLQTSVLLLLPDVFEVACNLREARGIGMSKRVAFLEGLRKYLRNRNEAAGYCLVTLLRAARHFKGESESSLMSFAMDVQHEVRDAVFRIYPNSGDSLLFEQDLMTAAFVSLAHLNFERCAETLAQSCLSPAAPLSFKNAVIQACSYFARQPNAHAYELLFTNASAFMQAQLRRLADLAEEGYVGDQALQSKLAEAGSSTGTICNILGFLDALPRTLFEGAPDDAAEAGAFYEQNFESFLACMVTANDSVRRLAGKVSRRLLTDHGILGTLRSSGRLGSIDFKVHFWRMTYVAITLFSPRCLAPHLRKGPHL